MREPAALTDQSPSSCFARLRLCRPLLCRPLLRRLLLRRLLRLALTSVAAIAFGLPAAPAIAGNDIDTLSFYLENDEFSIYDRSDRWYTSGEKLIWSYKDPDPDGLAAILAAVPRLMLWRPEGSDRVKVAGAVGQNIYTPQLLFTTRFQPKDRPYGGWLYVSGIAQRTTGRWTETADIKLGTIGPAALGRQTQDLIHRLLAQDEAVGWDNQMRPGVGIEFGYLARVMLPSGIDRVALAPHAGAVLGNLRNLVHVGGNVIFGNHLSTAQLPPSGEGIGDSLSPVTDPIGAGDKSITGWYGFFGVDQSYVVNNVFINGDTFGGTPTIPIKHMVAQLTAGFGVIPAMRLFGYPMRFSYSMSVRSKEFDNSPGYLWNPRQRFGNITLTTQF